MAIESHNEVQKVGKGEKVTQKLQQQQANGAHNEDEVSTATETTSVKTTPTQRSPCELQPSEKKFCEVSYAG